MDREIDVVLAYWNEQRQQFRQSENQRATMTNFILVIISALSGLIIQQKFADTTIPLGALIITLGVYGALISAKYHERAIFHRRKAKALTMTLKDLGALHDNPHLEAATARHHSLHRRLSHVRLHWFWTGLHIAVAIHGATLIIIAIIR